MRIAAVIPARLSASRFPGKPLAPISGMPMLRHVYERARLCGALSEVLIATCDREIAEAARAWGASVAMTSDRHDRASDRVAEAAHSLTADIVVMIQGDEPMIIPEMIERAVSPFAGDPSVVCSNLAAPILTEDEFLDPNTIKVVMAANGDALYFSRQPIPTRAGRPFAELAALKQVCVIPFRRDFLMTFARLTPTPLERAESIDMLRALEHGHPVRLVRSDHITQAVDTPADLTRVERLMAGDPLAATYLAGSAR